MANTILQDPEFGAVTVRRLKLARHVKLKIDQRGGISISMPPRAPLFLAKSLLAQSRPQVRQHLAKMQTDQAPLLNGELIGKSHRLILTESAMFGSRLNGTELHVTIPVGVDPQGPEAQQYIKEAALKALRTQAKAYLTRRLQTLAQEHGFNYNSIRFSNAGTRWGSCSSSGTISLNIWLMQLQFPLIDYVLVHELCHTRQMNHSPEFWSHVEVILPDYKLRRKLLKMQRPYL
jgi:predicted metal-dependent hydrolase